MEVLYVLLTIFVLLTVYFYARYRLLGRAIKKADIELQDIINNIDENQILKQEEYNKNLENLLVTINKTLNSIRMKRIFYENRDREFQKQIENISHDLRTPLTSILGYLKMLDVSELGEEGREDIEIVKRKAYLLQRLISQFYDYSRLTGEDYTLSLERIDISKILRETVIDYYQELSKKNLHMELNIPEKPIWLEGNQNAMERVFLNLLQNACRYATGSLRVSLEQTKTEVIVCFENNVEDFLEEDLDRIFERFYIKDSARSKESSGLGLTVAKYFVEKMNGKLNALLKEEEWLLLNIHFTNTETILHRGGKE